MVGPEKRFMKRDDKKRPPENSMGFDPGVKSLNRSFHDPIKGGSSSSFEASIKALY